VLSLSDGEFRRYLKQVFSVAIGDWVDKSIRFFSSGAELGREKKKLVEIMTTEVHATYLKAADLQESAKKNSQLKLTRFEKVLFLSVLDDL